MHTPDEREPLPGEVDEYREPSEAPFPPIRSYHPEREAAEQEAGQAYLERLSNAIDATPPLAERRLQEVLVEKLESATDLRPALAAFFRLLAQLLTAPPDLQRDPRDGVKEDAEPIVRELDDGTALVAGAEKLRLLQPGSVYFEDGSLRAEQLPAESKAEQSQRKTRLEGQLKNGATVEDIRRREEEKIGAADVVLGNPQTGTAGRDSAERDRDEARRNLDTLAQLEAERQDYVSRLNTGFNFRKLLHSLDVRGAAPAGVRDALQVFRDARFEVDRHLNVVVHGLSPDSVRSFRAAFPANYVGPSDDLFLEAMPDSLVLGERGSYELLFARNQDGTDYQLEVHRGQGGP